MSRSNLPLCRNDDAPWPEEQNEEFFQRIPEDWAEPGRDGKPRVKRDRRKQLPQSVDVDNLAHVRQFGS